MLTIDGSRGEGGGQVLRTSLALSMISRTPFLLTNIRARRKNPGLQRQHLASVLAAQEVSDAKVDGAKIGSATLFFAPGEVKAGEFTFSIGSAGSTSLVFQTVLPALMTGHQRSVAAFEGGTHNPMAPPFDSLHRSFVPLVNKMGPTVSVSLDRPGFYPRGGGRFVAEIEPGANWNALEVLERGPIERAHAVATVSGLPRHIAERELDVIRRGLPTLEWTVEVRDIEPPNGPVTWCMSKLRVSS